MDNIRFANVCVSEIHPHPCDTHTCTDILTHGYAAPPGRRVRFWSLEDAQRDASDESESEVDRFRNSRHDQFFHNYGSAERDECQFHYDRMWESGTMSKKDQKDEEVRLRVSAGGAVNSHALAKALSLVKKKK